LQSPAGCPSISAVAGIAPNPEHEAVLPAREARTQEPVTRYLITGGAGFIGSHLADTLAARGDGVAILDDLTT
jgi:GDP-mannose 4,6 dehydratase